MKTKEEIKQLAENLYFHVDGFEEEICIGKRHYILGYTQCQEDMDDKDKWTFEEILDACYPTLGRGSDWCDIAIRLKEQKLTKQD